MSENNENVEVQGEIDQSQVLLPNSTEPNQPQNTTIIETDGYGRPIRTPEGERIFYDKRGVARNARGHVMKGYTANKLGRAPNKQRFYSLFSEALKDVGRANGKKPEEIMVGIMARAIKYAYDGDFRYYQDIFNRLFGKPLQPMQIDHDEDDEDGKSPSLHKVEWTIRSYKKPEQDAGPTT